MMLVRVSLAKENPVRWAGLALANDIGVFQRVSDLEVFDFWAVSMDFAMPRVLMKNYAAGNHALRWRAGYEQYAFKWPHTLTCEGIHQPVKHQVRNVPHVPAILKLAQILRQVLLAHVNVRTADAALQDVPEAL